MWDLNLKLKLYRIIVLSFLDGFVLMPLLSLIYRDGYAKCVFWSWSFVGEGKWIGKKKKLKFSLYQSFFEVLTLFILLCMTAHTIPTKFLEPNTNQVFILGFFQVQKY